MQTSRRYRIKRILDAHMVSSELAQTPVGELMRPGGVEHMEYVAAAKAIEDVQREWLPVLEEMNRNCAREGNARHQAKTI